jgi:hypothetical protein
VIGNGLPHKPCGAIPGHHEVHTYAEGQTTPNFWCDGVPVLGPFVELTIRVPLVGYLDFEESDHERTLEAILEELGTFTWDEVDSRDTRTVLRLRQGGEDTVHPLRMVNGVWRVEK